MGTENRPIQMVVFDWAGTTVDYGSSAPSVVFDRVLTAAGLHLTREEINRPMGLEKKAHIRQLLSSESGSAQWQQLYGRVWNEQDVDKLYETFEATLHTVVAEYSTPLPGVAETVDKLRGMGLKIGSTTGYNSAMMAEVLPAAKAAGYAADCVVTPDATGIGRPAPFMVFECMRQLNVYPPRCVVKVGDTVVDMQEGKNAGAFAIGILTGSNLLGLTKEEYDAMPAELLAQRKQVAADRYRAAGVDLVIDSIRDLPAAIETLNERLRKEGSL